MQDQRVTVPDGKAGRGFHRIVVTRGLQELGLHTMLASHQPGRHIALGKVWLEECEAASAWCDGDFVDRRPVKLHWQCGPRLSISTATLRAPVSAASRGFAEHDRHRLTFESDLDVLHGNETLRHHRRV